MGVSGPAPGSPAGAHAARAAPDRGADAAVTDASAPLHRRLKDAILEAVGSGEWAEGERIPSERELCERHGVSRTTARHAVSALVHEGVLRTVGGRGTFVAPRAPRQEPCPRAGFEDDLRAQGLAVRAEVLDLSRIEAGKGLAAALGLRPFSPVIRLRRLRLSGDRPLAVQTSLLPEHLCPGLLRLDFARRSLFRTLREEHGHALQGGRTAIRAALAKPKEARLLRLDRPAAVLRTVRHTRIAGSEVIERCESSFPGAGFELGSDEDGPGPGALSPRYAAEEA